MLPPPLDQRRGNPAGSSTYEVKESVLLLGCPSTIGPSVKFRAHAHGARDRAFIRSGEVRWSAGSRVELIPAMSGGDGTCINKHRVTEGTAC